MSKPIEVEATIRVTYDPSHIGSGAANDLASGLQRAIFHQVSNGLLTSHTSAPVVSYDVSATILNPEDV